MNEDDFVTYLMNEKLIPDELQCLHCNSEITLITDDSANLGFSWRCFNRKCEFKETMRSFLSNSFFNNTIEKKKQLKASNYLIKKTKYEDLSDHVKGMSKKAIVKLKSRPCEKVVEYYDRNPVRLGGPDL